MTTTYDLNAELIRRALSSPTSRKIGIAFDSRSFLSHYENGLNTFLRDTGYAHWVGAYSLGVAFVPYELNGGIAGNNTEDFLGRQAAHIASLKAAGAGLVILLGGTNNWSSGIDLGTTKMHLRQIVANYQNAGIGVFMIAETPRGNADGQNTLTTADTASHYALHVWIRDVMSKQCSIVDIWDDMVDTTSGTKYFPLPSMVVADRLHLSKLGNQLIGKKLGPLLADAIHQLPPRIESNVVASATNITGTLTPNPLVSGTGGIFDANIAAINVAGSQLADSWTGSGDNVTGVVLTWSKETDSDGVTWQKVHLSGTSTSSDGAAQIYAVCQADLSTIGEGDMVRGTGLIKSQGTGLSCVALENLLLPMYSLSSDPDDSGQNSMTWPTELIGPLGRETIPTAKTAANGITDMYLRIDIMVQPGVALNADVWFTKCGLVKAVD